MLSGKVVIAGPSAAGKTCIIRRLVEDRFSADTQATTQAAYFRLEVKVDTKSVSLSLWDTAGQERFASVSPMYFRGAQFGLVVFDCTSRESFESSKAWAAQVKERSLAATTVFMIANKIDLDQARVISTSEGKAYAVANNMQYLEISAKTGEGAKQMLDIIARCAGGEQPDDDVDKPVEIAKVKQGCC